MNVPDQTTVPTIPLEIAQQICAEIRQEAEVAWYTQAARWCWTCQQATGGDPNHRGFLRAPGNRGCILINDRFAQQELNRHVSG
ncbi:MAG: hypothetical protein AB1894_21920 [Chloroflexota bacterium]